MEKRRILTLTAVRQAVGLTQMDLALAIGRSQTDISHWEKDVAIPPAKAEAILAVLRSHSREAVPKGLKATDLSRPWDEVLLEMAKVTA
jgi:DNA-binding transcriptional regulator YiaG